MYPKVIANRYGTSSNIEFHRDNYYYGDDHDYQDRYEYYNFYIYEVDGIGYSYKLKSSDKSPKEQIVIHYNPKDPKDAYKSSEILLGLYAIALLFLIVLLVFFFKKEKKLFKDSNFWVYFLLFIPFIVSMYYTATLLYKLVAFDQTKAEYYSSKKYNVVNKNETKYEIEYCYYVDNVRYIIVRNLARNLDKSEINIMYNKNNPEDSVIGSKSDYIIYFSISLGVFVLFSWSFISNIKSMPKYQKIKYSRESICIGDDCKADEYTIIIKGDNTLKDFVEVLINGGNGNNWPLATYGEKTHWVIKSNIGVLAEAFIIDEKENWKIKGKKYSTNTLLKDLPIEEVFAVRYSTYVKKEKRQKDDKNN